MTLTLVVDPTDRPAAFGVAAARLAARTGAGFMHLPARFDLSRDADAQQYVFSSGGLGPSGLFVAEGALDAGRPLAGPSTPSEIVAAATLGEIAVPVHPRFGQGVDALRGMAARAGVACRIVEIEADPERGPPSPAPSAGDPALSILFVGREREHRDVYPAARLSLLNAAEAIGIALNLRFADPMAIGTAGSSGITRNAAGILLPGGSDMANVPGQIRAARHAIEARVPVLGLCLGMQTMTTAFAQRVLGSDVVNLEEADALAPIKSFVSMAQEVGLPVHRTGDETVGIVPGTRLSAMLETDELTIRCNHRYRLLPDLRQRLAAKGLVVNAHSYGDRIVDGIEWPDHPFFVGLQGHPELGRRNGPHSRIFDAFLRAAESVSPKR